MIRIDTSLPLPLSLRKRNTAYFIRLLAEKIKNATAVSFAAHFCIVSHPVQIANRKIIKIKNQQKATRYHVQALSSELRRKHIL